jgi:SAM-dependent methyltransferase
MPKIERDWGSEVASIWPNYFPPCRPSISELFIYTTYLRDIQSRNPKLQPKLLILGSTGEFRDWGYQENLDVTIVDYSESYYSAITAQMKHRNPQERYICKRWQDMSFDNEFDLILGDLVVGNLQNEEIPTFLRTIARALTEDGYFMTKSFFRDDKRPTRSVQQIFDDFIKSGSTLNPFSALDYELSIASMDTSTGLLDFKILYNTIYEVYRKGAIDYRLMDAFSRLGWQDKMRFKFNIPTFSQWEEMLSGNLVVHAKEFGRDVYSPDFPIYILSKVYKARQ